MLGHGQVGSQLVRTGRHAILPPLGAGVSCPEPFRACLACGLVWTHLRPEDLRAFIDKHGNAVAKLDLPSFRKGRPTQDPV